jgi:hypothetical protein
MRTPIIFPIIFLEFSNSGCPRFWILVGVEDFVSKILRLGISKPASNRNEGKTCLERLLAEGGLILKTGVNAVEKLSDPIRKTLQDLVHNCNTAWPVKRFPPGLSSSDLQRRLRRVLPTEKDPGTGPPFGKNPLGEYGHPFLRILKQWMSKIY